MPNRGAHVVTAGVAGIKAADHGLPATEELSAISRTVYSGSCVLGAVWGGLAPDRIEPPDHPHHRDRAHSVLVLFLLAALLTVFVKVSEAKLLDVARSAEAEAGGSNLKAVAYCCLAGGPRGFAVGYLAHLGADGMAQGEGLPLISRSVG